MNYSNLTEDVSYLVRDASYDFAEDRHLAIMQDPHQQWSSRGSRPTVRVDDEFVTDMFDMC